jgi:hypothetical protein
MSDPSKEGRSMNENQGKQQPSGARILINGPLQLSIGDIFKLGSLLVLITASYMQTQANLNEQDLRHKARLDSIEREVAAVNERSSVAAAAVAERASIAITSEIRAVTLQLSAIERRLARMETIFDIPTPTYPRPGAPKSGTP